MEILLLTLDSKIGGHLQDSSSTPAKLSPASTMSMLGESGSVVSTVIVRTRLVQTIFGKHIKKGSSFPFLYLLKNENCLN